MTGRFAPSPTGRMHLGNVYAALLSWLFAKSQGSAWLLRIEDLDPERSSEHYADQILRDLEWLGLTWDGDVLYQSRRKAIYEYYYDRLTRLELVYPCFCTRADIMATQAPHQTDNRIVYAGTCRALTPADVASMMTRRKPAWRMIMPDRQSTYTDLIYGEQRANLRQQCGDIIIRRADGAFAYQLAVTIDDALCGIQQVVRGRDLLLSAHQQMAIATTLGLPTQHYAHLPLLINEHGQRLSKRDESLHLGVLKEHYTPQQIIGMIAYKSHITPYMTPMTAQEVLNIFDYRNLEPKDIVISA